MLVFKQISAISYGFRDKLKRKDPTKQQQNSKTFLLGVAMAVIVW